MGYSVAINDPYKGVELIRKHGRPAERRHSLQIEVNRKLYMDEATLTKNEGFARLKANLGTLLQALAGFVESRA
jgi:N-formylglutamate amidohydrolase